MHAQEAEGSSHQDSPHQRRWELWFAVAIGLATFGFGFYGLRQYETDNQLPVDPWSIGYHTLQLFLLEGAHLEHEVPWQLSAGRWFGAAFLILAVARTYTKFFGWEWRLFLARARGGHIVVCGLGSMSLQLAKEFDRQKMKGWFGQRKRAVIVIEGTSAAEAVAEAYHAGFAVIKGDACEEKTLRRAALGRAYRVIAASPDDQMNVAAAAKVGEVLRTVGGAQKLDCWLFVADPRLREMLRPENLFPFTGNSKYEVNVRGLDFFELAARQVFRKVPLDYDRIRPEDTTVVHLVICGFGSMGQQLALQAARIGHFANFKKVRLTIVEQEGSRRMDGFLKRYPSFKKAAEFHEVEVYAAGEQFDPLAAIGAIRGKVREGELVTVAACWERTGRRESDSTDFFRSLGSDDTVNLSLALALDAAKHHQVLAFQTRRSGFGALFSVDGRGAALGTRVFPFGMLEETWSVETLLHEKEDAIAKMLHADYLEKQLKTRKVGERPAIYPWEELKEQFRESNRRAADHIRVKARAIGHVVSPLRGDVAALSSLDDRQIELLAPMEHESWCAEMWLQGYTYGVRDDPKKTHDSLKPWDELDDAVKQWDVDQVNAIPAALEKAGFGIYLQGQ